MSKKNAIIIGAGIGGLTSAIALLTEGIDVIIYERLDKVGGVINTIDVGTHSLDLSTSIFIEPEIFKEVFTWANKNYLEYFNMKKIDPMYKVNFEDGTSYTVDYVYNKFFENIGHVTKNDKIGFERFIEDTYKHYKIAKENFLNNPYDDITDFINPKTLMSILKLDTFNDAYSYISHYVKNERLRRFLAFQCFYIGISPYKAPSIFTLIPMISYLNGIWYIEGGPYAYIEALKKLILELGGKIIINKEVEEIIIEDNKVIGIKVDDKVEKSDFVICNSDFATAMNTLIKDEKFKAGYNEGKLQDKEYTCSTFILYLVLDKKYDALEVHNVLLSDDFKMSINSVFEGWIPENPSIYIYCPSKIDLKYKDDECINILLRVPNLNDSTLEYNGKLEQIIEKIIITQLKKIKGLEDIDSHITSKKYFTPKDFEKDFKLFNAACYGLSPILKQSNYFRPHIKYDKIKGLYFIGSSVHPGSGASTVIYGSKILKKIIKDDF